MSEISRLKAEVSRLTHSKLELIRSTSCEIERLRTIIKILTGTDKIESLQHLIHDPSKYADYLFKDTTSNISTNEENEAGDEEERKASQTGDLEEEEEMLRREAEDKFGSFVAPLKPPPPKSVQAQSDTLFRLSSKRMSYTGFEFSDFGFMTTDFDQLSRGHTSWVNHVIHHKVQNGICISASDDWSIMFWRLKRLTGRAQLQQEKYDRLISKFEFRSPERKAIEDKVKENTPNIKLDHLTGEVALHPVLKINTGLEVKAIQISHSGELLACTCFDDEEDEGNPELQLYFDHEQKWEFDPSELEDDAVYDSTRHKDDDRVIKRQIVPLEFEPVPRALSITKDSRYVFVAMFSTKNDVAAYKEENPEDEEYPSACSALVVVHVVTKIVRKCARVDELMADDEYITAMDLSPDGVRLAVGTNNGRLIAVGTHSLMDPSFDIENANPTLNKMWVSALEGISGTDMEGAITSVVWSDDSEWIVSGHGNGVIKIWKKNKEKRMSVNTNKTLSLWMKKAHIKRKQALFSCKWQLEGQHMQAVNSLSLRGSILISGSDDGSVLIHDLLETFADHSDSTNAVLSECSPVTIAEIPKIHQGRMVNSVALSSNYTDQSSLIPTLGAFMISSGADNVLHCISVLDMVRESIRKKYYSKRDRQ